MSRWINADAVCELFEPFTDAFTDVEVTSAYVQTLMLLANAPSIDIVRCQDCKHWVYNFNGCSRNPCTEPWYATDFCNYGEREGE